MNVWKLESDVYLNGKRRDLNLNLKRKLTSERQKVITANLHILSLRERRTRKKRE